MTTSSIADAARFSGNVLAIDIGGVGGQFVLSAIAIMVGGGSVQLFIFLLKRRGELKALDRTSEATERGGQADFIDRVFVSEEKANKRADRLEEQMKQYQVEFADQTKLQRRENARLSSKVASLSTDLSIAQRQVVELQRQLDTALNTADLLRQLSTEVKATSATGRRMESAAEDVAADLAARNRRADAVTDGEPGEAADAASQSRPERDD